MPGYMTIGGYKDWSTINYNDQEYDILAPRQMLLDLLVYKKEPVEWDMKSIVIVGPQGSGKTVMIRYVVKLIQSIKKYKDIVAVVRTNDLRILADHRYYKLFDQKGVIVLIVDDVIREGFDSRRAMSGANVDLTQQFCVTRHILEENYRPNGIIFLIFATQIYTRIDPTIRNTAQLKVFTAYYDERWFEKLFTPEQAELIRVSTYEGMFSSNFDARRFAVCKTMTGDVATIEIPYSSSRDVPIKYIDRNMGNEQAIELLVTKLLKRFDNFDNYKQSEITGYLITESKEIEDKYSIRLKSSDFTKSIYIARWRRREQIDSIEDRIIEIDLDGSISNKDKIISVVKARKIASVEDVAKATNLKFELANAYLANNRDIFERVHKGHYCIKGENYTIDDIYNLTNKKPEKPMKSLIM